MKQLLLVLTWLLACQRQQAVESTSGGAEPVEAQPDVERAAAPAAHEPVETTMEADDASFESLVTRIEPTQPGPTLTLQAAVESCPPPHGTDRDARLDWFDTCDLRSTLAHDREGSRWVGLVVDYSEGGPEGFVLWEWTPRRERELLRAEVSPLEVGNLLRRVQRERLVAAENIVRGAATTLFSLNEYAPLVELGAPLAGWRLWIETTDDLDRPEHVAWLFSAEGTRHELARRVGELGPCDGDGFWCEATDAECDEAGLRAENRLCVLPVGVVRVAVAGGTLGVLGGIQVAGHGGYPPFHWMISLPTGLGTERSRPARE